MIQDIKLLQAPPIEFDLIQKRKKITLIPIADLHTGGTTALHPNKKRFQGQWEPLSKLGGWNYSNRPNFYPSSEQLDIWNHLEKCLDWAKIKRKDSQLVLVVDGDAIEGDHHNTPQLVTRDIPEMMLAHEELMLYIKDRLDWQAGDMLFYVHGTDVHTRNTENMMAEKLGAYQYPDGNYCSSFLELILNGAKVWIYHQGVKAGTYPTRGEALARELKKIFYKCKMEGQSPPILVITAHTHDPVLASYSQDWQTMQGIILPSWQQKTRLVLDRMPLSLNEIGMQVVEISEDGVILPIEKPMLMNTPSVEVVTIG